MTLLTIIANALETLFKRSEVVTSDDIKTLMKMAKINISDSELSRILMTLEIYKKIYVRRIKKENREIYQIVKRK